MASVNTNVYTTKTENELLRFSDTIKTLYDTKKIQLNSPYDLTICPWKIDMLSKTYAVSNSKLIEIYNHKFDKIVFQSNSSWKGLKGVIPCKTSVSVQKTDSAGKGFANWAPDMIYDPEYDFAFKTQMITKLSYNDYACCIYVRASNGFDSNGYFQNIRIFTLSEYRSYSNNYKYVLNVFLYPLFGRDKRINQNNIVAHNGLGSQNFNFTTETATPNFSLKFDNMIDILGRMHSIETEKEGIPVLGIFDRYGSCLSYANAVNISSISGVTYTTLINYEIFCNNLTPSYKDLTATSDPENPHHTVLFWFEISPDEIVKQCLKYGVIVSENYGGATDVTNSRDETYIPIIKGGSVTNDYTNGNNNQNNPNLKWADPWNDAGYDPSDPNSYTDKIELSKPGLTTTGIFNRTFALTANSVKNLADYLWNADESIFNEIVKGLSLMGGNPIDGLIDLRLYPFDVSAKAGGGNAQSIVVGRTDTKVTGLQIDEYNAVLELGSCTFHEKFGNFLDYEPFTTASLYIPYVGIVPISTADFMGQTISCKMVVDITTGSCTAIVFANEIPIIYKNGNIGVEIPMTGTNSAEYASRIAGGLTSGATDIALGAASKSVGQVVSGVGAIADSALSVNNTMYNTAGSSSPACGLWQPQNCYFIIQRPVPIVPENYGHTVGYACNYQSKIGDCSGYTQTYNVDVSSINAPESEKNAIAEILNSGFYA